MQPFEERAMKLSRHAFDIMQSRYVAAGTPIFSYSASNTKIEREKGPLTEEIITFVALQMFGRDEFTEFIDLMAGINLPFATHFSATAYGRLIELETQKRPGTAEKSFFMDQTIALLENGVYDDHPLKQIVKPNTEYKGKGWKVKLKPKIC